MPRADEEKRRWIAAGAGAALVFAVTLALFRIPAAMPGAAARHPAGAAAPSPGARVVVISRDPLVAETAQFTDPRPLFLPTRWNGSQKELRPPEMGAFPGYPPKFAFRTDKLDLDLPPAVNVPAGAAGVLARVPSPGYPVQGIGLKDAPAARLPAREALVRVTDARTGELVWSRPLQPGVLPALGAARAWRTQRFLAAVGPAGFVVAPVPMAARLGAGGGFVRLDRATVEALQEALANRLFLGQVLEPGFYRISVGP
ncbi:MAG: hypothetical protein ACREFX_02865 [Opitutaceae bacterium]